VVLIGMDGVDPRVVERLWRQGELPALRDLADRGAWARLETACLAASPVV
jgi:predicted AlkP superfamily phosphohydrolase/phosphomutase